MRSIEKIILVVLLTLKSFSVASQNTIGLPLIINYDKSQYRGGAQTWDIAQDAKGVMYFANNEGLITFDGSHWNIFPTPNHTIIRSLAISPDNKVFVGAQGEIGYFETNDAGIFTYRSLKTLIPEKHQLFADIWNIELSDGIVFFQATDKIFQLQHGSISVAIPASEWQFMGQTDRQVIAQDKTRGLFTFRNGIWIPVRGSTIPENVTISGVLKMAEREYLLTTAQSRTFLLRNDSLTESPIRNSELQHITAAQEIGAANFVIGRQRQGCLIGDHYGRTIQTISKRDGLANNNILCVFVDRDQNIWTGSTNAISFIAFNSPIKYIHPNSENQISGYSTLIHNNRLYIATSDGAYVTPLSKEYSDLSFSKSAFRQIKNTEGEIWNADIINNQVVVGHAGGAAQVIGDRAEKISEMTGVWLFRPLQKIAPATHILAGTFTGLHVFSGDGPIINEGLANGLRESFRFIEIDEHDRIWASHPYRGIYRITLSADRKKYTARLYRREDGLPSDLENFVFKLGNKVVFATLEGIFEYDRESDRFRPSATFSRVFGKTPIRFLTADTKGNIWFCSDKKFGVAEMTGTAFRPNYKIRYIPQLTGEILSGFENVLPYDSENIFIGSEKGIVHYNFKKYLASQRPLHVLFSKVTAGTNDSILLNAHTAINPGSIFSGPQNLPTGYKSFHFSYSSPQYATGGIQYSYRLLGYEKHWSGWSEKSEKDYTNLPAGKYVFEVRARDNLSQESPVAAYSFRVSPFWYETTTAVVFYTAFLILLGVLFYLQHKKKLKNQKLLFEEEQKRINEIHQLMLEKNEKEIIKLQNEKLQNEIRFKRLELADANLHLDEHGGVLAKVKEELKSLYEKTNKNKDIKKALQIVNEFEKNNENWDQFVTIFDEINNDYLKNLKQKYPRLTKTDLKLCTYLQGNLSSKEISQMMNISVRGVEIARYRLRKKLNLETSVHLNDFLNSFNS